MPIGATSTMRGSVVDANWHQLRMREERRGSTCTSATLTYHSASRHLSPLTMLALCYIIVVKYYDYRENFRLARRLEIHLNRNFIFLIYSMSAFCVHVRS